MIEYFVFLYRNKFLILDRSNEKEDFYNTIYFNRFNIETGDAKYFAE